MHHKSYFYPGFFVKTDVLNWETKSTIQNYVDKNDANIASKSCLVFKARKRIDERGKSSPLSSETASKLSLLVLPEIAKQEAWFKDSAELQSLKQFPNKAIIYNVTKPQVIKNTDKLKYMFGLQNGIQLSLKEIFSGGLLYSSGKEEYFFAGVYEPNGIFRSAYAITWDGYFVPGSSDDSGMFVPFLKNKSADDLVLEAVSSEDRKQNLVFERFLEIPCFPKSSKLSSKKEWCCVKDGICYHDSPYCITMFFEQSFCEDESINFYIGGYLDSDNRYYLYGQFDKESNFTPGKFCK